MFANYVGGIPEIICEGYNGVLSHEKTGESIYKALRKMITMLESDEGSKLYYNCIATAQKFNVQETVNKMRELYYELTVTE